MQECTTDQPAIKNHPKCFKCEKFIKCAVRGGSEDDFWSAPWGVVFKGGSNYGSSIYDTMMDGIEVRVIVCDECLEKHSSMVREIQQ